MSIKIHISLILMALIGINGQHALGQLSPGDLAKVHAHLEGLANCTQCHTIGQKVDNSKCLECHQEINNLIKSDRGMHAAPSVLKQDCFACHSDHHGRNFDMVRFDSESFEHDITGYSLEGAHRTVDCRSCHRPDNILDVELSRRSETYLGLAQECAGCHEDVHQGSLSTSCNECHTMESFVPATQFDHSLTDFPLAGAHISVSCSSCHTSEANNGVLEFTVDNFSSCTSCHDDAHLGRLGSKCSACHTVVSFDQILQLPSFDHQTTGFELKGSHEAVNCASCHDADKASPVNVFTEFTHFDVVNCFNCHDDPHEARFGNDCAACHNERSFRDVEMSAGFDHNMTDFPLEGMHLGVRCQECHESSYSLPIEHNRCMACHDDYHEGQIVPSECSSCHVVTGFAQSTFDIERHSATQFALEGAHIATPCIDCHRSEEGTWRFADLGTDCRECHEDVHYGRLARKYYTPDDCASCHGTSAWADIAFDHSLTGFELTGAHVNVRCGSCHVRENDVGSPVVFQELGTLCTDCHNEPHGAQFLDGESTSCTSCHSTGSWQTLVFDHDSTRFPLDGAHALVKCSQCHATETSAADVAIVRYRPTPMQCSDCH